MIRRSRFEIYMDIMTAMSDGPKNPTRLMCNTNISWAPLQECLRDLIKRGLVQENGQNSSRKSYALTQKGNYVISRYKDFIKDINQFDKAQITQETDLSMVH